MKRVEVALDALQDYRFSAIDFEEILVLLVFEQNAQLFHI